MNIYKGLNDITKYIEDNLDNEISYDKLAKFLCVNSYTMQRIFSLVAGISICEYIRKRRLTSAGMDLYNKKSKVIDIALKYQYNNATSFSRAFEKFHGIKPSMVSGETKLKCFPKITFDETIHLKAELTYNIISMPKLHLYGKWIKVSNLDICKKAPKFFSKIKNQYGMCKCGMTTYSDIDRYICQKYYVLYDKKISNLEDVIIPKSKWLVFNINSTDSTKIQEMIHKFYLEFLPTCKYNLKDIPELEYYHDNMTDFMIAIE